jgi:integrase
MEKTMQEQTKRRGRGQAVHPQVAMTERQFKNYKPKAEEYSVGDSGAGKGGTLRLIVKPNGTKTWHYFYSFKGKQEKLVIGEVNSVAEAHAEVDKARILLREGISPAAAKAALKKAMRPERKPAAKGSAKRAGKAERSAAADPAVDFSRPYYGPVDAFERVARLYVESYAKPRKRMWRESQRLLQSVIPALEGKRLSELKRNDWLAVLTPMWRKAPIVTNRLHSELTSMGAWAAGLKRHRQLKAGEQDFIDPPAELANLFDHASPFAGVPKKGAENPARKRVLRDAETALVWRAAEHIGFPYGDIVKLLILTGARRCEISKLSWQEIDADHADPVLNLPGERTKNKLDFVLPLTPNARAVLTSLPRFARNSEIDFAFGRMCPPDGFGRAKKQLDEAIAELNNGNPIPHWVFHDLRRTCVTGLAKLGVLPHVREAVVNHVGGFKSGVAGTYDTYDYLPEKRAALELWADHVNKIISTDVASASKIAEPA